MPSVSPKHVVVSSSRLGLAAIGALGLLAAGCHGEVQARNPSFTAAVAPDPTIVVAPIACHGPGRPGSAALDAEYQRLAREKGGVATVTATPEQERALCSMVLEDKRRAEMPYTERLTAGSRPDWSGGADVTSVVQAIAEAHHAKSVFVTTSLGYQVCAELVYMVDSEGHKVIREHDAAPGPQKLVNEEKCGSDYGARMRGYLFASDGAMVWKSWFDGRVDNGDGMARGIANLFTGVPAHFSAAAEGAAPEAPTASAPPDAAPSPAPAVVASNAGAKAGSDAVVARELGANAPPTCRALARSLCASAAMPNESPDAACSRVSRALAPLAKSPMGASVCSAQLAARGGS